MSALIKVQTKEFRITGDGVSTSVFLSLAEDPFPANAPGKVVDISFQSTDPNLTSISFTAKTCTIGFASPFTGDAGPISLFVSYDPS